jgi:hypothetical protein
MISIAPPFVLRFSKDERRFFSRIEDGEWKIEDSRLRMGT